jgi:hypothetical protein
VGTAGGGIWKSTNAGATFKPIFDKYCQSIGAVAINQSTPNIIFAGTGENIRYEESIYKMLCYYIHITDVIIKGNIIP